jgi:hypothetical protein
VQRCGGSFVAREAGAVKRNPFGTRVLRALCNFRCSGLREWRDLGSGGAKSLLHSPITHTRPTRIRSSINTRDLIDAMAIELMRSRKAIARCALCSKFFFRQWNKDKYCSTTCGSEARRQQQLEWITNKRHSQGKDSKKGRKAH